jgi:hypothetical protein
MTHWNLSHYEGGGVCQKDRDNHMREEQLVGWLIYALLAGFGVAAFFTRISALLERSNILIFVIFAPALVVGLFVSTVLLGQLNDFRVTIAYTVGFMVAFWQR